MIWKTVFNLLFFFFLLCNIFAQHENTSSNIKTANHTELKGSPFWLILPEGYNYSDMHSGFVNKNGSHTNLRMNKTTKVEFDTYWKKSNANERFIINNHKAVKRLFKEDSEETILLVLEIELENNVATFTIIAKSKKEYEEILKSLETMYL